MQKSNPLALKAAEQFRFEGQVESAYPYGLGHINDTYVVNMVPAAELPRRYIMQRLNRNVFKRPDQVMENIALVTHFLRQSIEKRGGNPDREALTLILTKDGKDFLLDEDGEFWRAYIFIENAVSLQMAEKPEQFYQAAKAFGQFQLFLNGFPADRLHETIVNFHNTATRLETLKEVVKLNPCGRVAEVQAELDFVMQREADVHVLLDAHKRGDLPLRVTHNDTKLNNVMLDEQTGEGVCVIDLDTVMPGLALYDYGDAIRFGASSAEEDETDLDKVYFDLEKASAFTDGFIESAGSILTDKEIELMPWGAKLMTFECGIRFLGDYINGDQYFKIHRPAHNLDRCRTQLKLVADMERQWEAYQTTVALSQKSYGGK